MPVLFLVITASLTFAQTPARPEFEVATIKLNTTVPDVIDIPEPVGGRFHFPFNSLRMLIATAYNLKPFEILGGPAWIASDGYDVEAKSAKPKTSEADFRLMMQDLLADRFRLKLHRETRQLTAYTLVSRVKGPWVPKPHTIDCVTLGPGVIFGPNNPPLPPPGQPFTPPTICGAVTNTRKGTQGSNITMRQLVAGLTNVLAAPVTDSTGYTAPFDVDLEFTREGASVTDDSPPSISTALQEQLGLRLEAHKARTDVLVVDHAEKPTDN